MDQLHANTVSTIDQLDMTYSQLSMSSYFFPVLGLPAVLGLEDFGRLVFGRAGVGSS